MKKIVLLSLVLVLGFSAFSQENFDSFYNKFCDNPNFQLKRIKFPLKGGISEDYIDKYGDHNSRLRSWKRSDWGKRIGKYNSRENRQYGYVYEIDRQRTKVQIGLYVPNSDIGTTMIFKLINNKWYLVYDKTIF